MGTGPSKPTFGSVDDGGSTSTTAAPRLSPHHPSPSAAGVAAGTDEVPRPTRNDGAASAKEPASGGGGGGGCPMKHSDGSYSFSLSALSRGFQHPPVAGQAPPSVAATAAANMSGSKSDGDGRGSACPVAGKPKKQQEYNVYSQPIDPSNQMPAGTANQLPAPQQSKPLSTDRVVSNIPKGGAEDGKTWTYPSPQMFFNALARKGKLSDTQEEDMENVVAMHNNMNEKTWRKILQWEDLAGHPAESAKLLKFQGRPTDLSPKALFKSRVLGHPLPFDRHDWVVLRDDGTTVRYVIDYYYDESRARDTPESAVPSLGDAAATPSLLVDVRPALDGPRQLYERMVAMPMARRVFRSTNFEPLSMLPTAGMKAQVSESIEVWKQIQAGATASSNAKPAPSTDAPAQDLSVTERQAAELAEKFSSIRKKCSVQEKRVGNCGDDESCAKASLDWTLCAAPVLCGVQHEAFRKALEDGGSEEQIASALESVTACVGWQASVRKVAKSKYPEAFERATA